MARRSLKGHVANCSSGFLRFLNALVILAAIPIIVIVFVLKPSPTVSGWALIALGIISLLSGLFGCCAVNQTGCCSIFHILFVLLSLVGLVVVALVIFINPQKVYDSLSPTLTYPPPMTMVKAVGVTCFLLACFQVLILVMGCFVSCCGLGDFYEDLEAQDTAKELARQQMEEEKRRAKIEASSAHQLAQRMKEKYGGSQPKDYEVGSRK